jgi:hypothetical protein
MVGNATSSSFLLADALRKIGHIVEICKPPHNEAVSELGNDASEPERPPPGSYAAPSHPAS